MPVCKFANIALNLPLFKYFTYAIPEYLNESVKVGVRVIVPFSSRNIMGICIEMIEYTDIENVKDIKSVIEEEPVLSKEMLEFGKWLADYYITPPGEVLFNFLPEKVLLVKKIHYKLSDDYVEKIDAVGRLEDVYNDIIKVFESAKGKKISLNYIKKKYPSLLSRHLNFLSENKIITEVSYFPKTVREKKEKIVIRNFDTLDLDDLIEFKRITSQTQKDILRKLSLYKYINISHLKIKKSIPYNSINSLINKGLIKIEEKIIDRETKIYFEEIPKDIILNDEQKSSLDQIIDAVNNQEFRTFLLHGITGSGKTEIYIRSLKSILEKNKSGIILVPEISLTPQLINRFKYHFGNNIGVIHSRISVGEKFDTYRNIANGKYQIVIGARSALFAPLKNIGIIIVDEEHDSSYKQENSPRYNARDAAVIRGSLNMAVVLLGSATPSIESYYNSSQGKYQLLKLTRRATDALLPEIKILDLKKANKKIIGKPISNSDYVDNILLYRKNRYLSDEMIIAIGDRIEKKEGVIILQNKRGYHSYIECLRCGHVEQCKHCNLTLTYHKTTNSLICHLCGFATGIINNCSKCGSDKIISLGTGTERVEDELKLLFNKAVIKRVDSDVLKSKYLYQNILSDFFNNRIDVLVGTQIISKGLDFPNVTLVCVINADIGLLLPDFRATERTFQLLTQVSGRSGRSRKRGEVIIQTYHGDYEVFKYIKNHDYSSFVEFELENRRIGKYPPFYRLGLIEIKSKNEKESVKKAEKIYQKLNDKLRDKSIEILKPSKPLFSKVKDFYRYHIILKIPKKSNRSQKSVLNVYPEIITDFKSGKNIKVLIDNDPLNLL